MGGIEEALGVELGFQLLEGNRQIPRPLRGQGIAVELVGPVPGEDGDPPLGNGLHAVFRAEPEAGGLPPEHDAPQGPLRVLEGEVVVPGGIHFIIGELAPDVHVLEHGLAVQQKLDQLVYLGNAENVLFHGVTSRRCARPGSPG